MNCSPSGFAVHEIFQARILGWVAISYFRGSARPRDRNCVSWVSPALAGTFFTIAPPGKPLIKYLQTYNFDFALLFTWWMPEFMHSAWGVSSWGVRSKFVMRKFYFYHCAYMSKFKRITLYYIPVSWCTSNINYQHTLSSRWENQSVTTVGLHQSPTVSPQPYIHQVLHKGTGEWLNKLWNSSHSL